jgi:hypothetical protein
MIETALFTLHTGPESFRASFDLREMQRWALAVSQAARFFPQVALVTDARGRYLLKERMGLPFTEVIEALEAVPAGLAFAPCAGKLWGYLEMARRGVPFMGIDGDLFWWRRPDARLLDAPALAQEVHMMDAGLGKMVASMAAVRTEMPRSGKTCCACLLGGNDVAGLLAYAEEAVALISDERLEPIFRGAKEPWQPVSSCEEALFVARFGERIEVATPPRPGLVEYDRAGFTHLMGAKADPLRALQVETRLGLDHPEVRKRVLEVWWDELSREMPGGAVA